MNQRLLIVKDFIQNLWVLSIQKKLALLALVLSLGFGSLSQFLFAQAQSDRDKFWRVQDWLINTSSNQSPLPGLFFAILSGIVFLFCIFRLGLFGERFDFTPSAPAVRPPRFGLWLTSLGLSALAAATLTYTGGEQPSGYLSLGLWLLAVILMVISVLIEENWRPPHYQTILNWGKNNWSEILIVGFIVAAAFYLRVTKLEIYPYSFVNDEGEMGKAAWCMLQGNCSDFFRMAWAAQPYMAMLPIALSLKIFGISAFAARFPMAVLGTLAVLNTYLFAREVLDRRIAWIAAALMATLPVLVHFSRLGVDNLVDAFFSSAIIWLLYRGAKHNDRLAYMLAGVIGGLTIYSYPGARLSLALGLGSVIYLCIRTKNYLAAHLPHLIVFVAVLVVTMLPMTAVFIQHPENFAARFKQEGIFSNGIVTNESQQPGQSLATVVIKQFFRSSLVYIASPAEDGFFMGSRAYLTPLAAIFFVLGLAMVTMKIGDPRYMTLFAWFWAAILLGSSLTASPPSNERMMNSMPALAIITALGLAKAAEIFEGLGKFARRASPFLLIIIVLFINYKDYSFYFMEYAQKHSWENSTNELTYESRRLIQPLGSLGRFYLIGDPLVYKIFANFDYFSPDVEKTDFNTVSRETIGALPKDKDALFIAVPYREADLKQVAALVPGGIWTEFLRRYQPDQVLFFSYKISKEQLQGFKPSRTGTGIIP